MATLLASNDLRTPARAELQQPSQSSLKVPSTTRNTVTPHENKDAVDSSTSSSVISSSVAAETISSQNSAGADESASPEQPFPITKSDASATSSTSKRGLVSRRGRGLATPGNRSSPRTDYPLQTLAQVVSMVDSSGATTTNNNNNNNTFERPMPSLPREAVNTPPRKSNTDLGVTMEVRKISLVAIPDLSRVASSMLTLLFHLLNHSPTSRLFPSPVRKAQFQVQMPFWLRQHLVGTRTMKGNTNSVRRLLLTL
jgi:hypothetical protein